MEKTSPISEVHSLINELVNTYPIVCIPPCSQSLPPDLNEKTLQQKQATFQVPSTSTVEFYYLSDPSEWICPVILPWLSEGEKRQSITRQIIFSEDLSVAGSFNPPGADSPSPNPGASLRNALGSRRSSPQGRTDVLEPNHPAPAGLVLHSRRLQSWQEMIQAQGWSEQVWPFPLCMRWQRTCIMDLSWTAYWFKGFQVVWDKAHLLRGILFSFPPEDKQYLGL